MKRLDGLFFVLGPKRIGPRVVVAVLRHFRMRPQVYRASEWTSWEWGFLRIYHWPKQSDSLI